MRILHTGDWHLGRAVRQVSRLPEFERALDAVVRIARDERVDAVIVAGDIFDRAWPHEDDERLLYDTLARLVSDGAKIVLIAGNHDSPKRLDAIARVLELASIYCVGRVPVGEGYRPLRIASRDGSEAATIVAVPWVPERMAVDFEQLSGEMGEMLHSYAGRMEQAIAFYCRSFAPDTANIFAGHLLVDGASIGPDGGERPIHLGQAFAVKSSALPSTATYIALGHVHRPQEIVSAAPAFYAGSLLQLDFGEGGQEKTVNVADVSAGRPAQTRRVAVDGGRGLHTVRLRLDELAEHADRYGDDYLRVFVELERPALSLFDRVRYVLPNALDVTPVLPQHEAAPPPEPGHRVSPEELFARYYAQRHAGAEVTPELLSLFAELYRAEADHAPA